MKNRAISALIYIFVLISKNLPLCDDSRAGDGDSVFYFYFLRFKKYSLWNTFCKMIIFMNTLIDVARINQCYLINIRC